MLATLALLNATAVEHDVSLHQNSVNQTPFNLCHQDFERTDGELTYFVAERATVLLTDVPRRRTSQLLQIQLRPSTGALFAQSPYFQPDSGLLGTCTVEVDANLGGAIRLGETGVTTSRKVKYSHPVDGNAHFSQDGRVYTRIRRQSVRLDTQNGHLFEFHAFGLDAFDTIQPGQEKKRRLYMPFATTESCDAVTVSAEWMSKDRLRTIAKERGESLMPVTRLPHRTNGKQYLACLLGHPNEELQARSLLVVNLHPADVPNGLTASTLIFMGAWDPDQGPVRPGDTLGFLAFSYPCLNVDELRARLGSVDYDPENSPRAG